MTKNSRFLTACTSCRKLKRKCDYMKLGHGPCTNCITRKIAHLCVLEVKQENDEDKKIEKEFEKKIEKEFDSDNILKDDDRVDVENGNVRYEHDYEHTTTISYSRKRRVVSTYPDLSLSSSMYSKITSKLLSACVVKFFQNPEWCFFLDEDVLMNAVIERQTAVDRDPISLLYILSACIILRRGVQVSLSSGFKGSRKLLTGELFLAHMKCSESSTKNSLITLQAMILRSHYYLHMEQNELAWESLYKAIGIYNSLAIPPRVSGGSTIRSHEVQQSYDQTWTALCCLETTICSFTNRKSTLLLLSQQDNEDYPSLFNYDFRLDRRWRTLWFIRETQLLIESEGRLDEKNQKFANLDTQIINYIQVINDQEGKLLPYGQITLYGCLIKLCTQNILDIKNAESNIAIDYDLSTLISTKLNILERISKYSTDFANYLNTLAANSPPPALGSAPFFAMYVFQTLTCIWIQAAMENKSAGNCGNSFSQIKVKISETLANIRDDRSICKRTTVLFNGLDILSYLKLDEQDPYNVKIPIQLQGGIATVSKAWDDERSRLREEEVWSNFKPFLDDNKFWSTLTAQAEFDYTMSPLDTQDWFRLI